MFYVLFSRGTKEGCLAKHFIFMDENEKELNTRNIRFKNVVHKKRKIIGKLYATR